MAPCHATKSILNILQSGQNLLSSKDSILSDDDLVLDNLSSIPMAATAAVILKPIFMSDMSGKDWIPMRFQMASNIHQLVKSINYLKWSNPGHFLCLYSSFPNYRIQI